MAVTVVYLDSVFLLNALMDYLLLLAAGRLAGLPPRRGRYLLAALLGGAYAAAVFLPGGAFLASPWVKAAAGVLVGLAAYGGEERLLRMLLLFLGVSCGMAGAVLVVGLLAGGVPMMSGVFYTDVSARVLLIAATAAYLVLSVVFRASAAHGMRGELLPVKVCIGGRVQTLTALWDTGNSLRDPVGGSAVLVLAAGSIRDILPRGLRFLLEPEQLARPADTMELLCRAAPELHPRLLPYHAVGVRSGLLLAIGTDWIEVAGRRYPHGIVGLSPTELGTGYTALWGGAGKGGDYERAANHLAGASGPAGAHTGRGRALHWRQRDPAVAAGQEAGSRAAAAAGPGGCQEGADRA